MGSYQKKLQYTIDNNTTAEENITSAESVIRDADMAKSMMDYVKDSILSQTSQAMLAQANQNSGAVLRLLQ
jgi:flagellin